MVDDHRRRHNSEKSSIDSSTPSYVSAQSCDGNIINPNSNNTASEKTSCRPFKAKDLWKIYGTLIARWCRAARNNNKSSVQTSPLSSSPPPPETSSTSLSSSNDDKTGLEEGDQPAASAVAFVAESQRVNEEMEVENTTTNGIHSLRYTTTDPKSFSSFSSKNGSRRCASPLSFVHRCISSRKPTTPPPAEHHHAHRDHSSFAAASLSRNASQKSTSSRSNIGGSSFSRSASQRNRKTPIMFSNSAGWKAKPPPPPMQQNLECTLEELCYGCTKEVKVTRVVLTDRWQIVQEEETLSIEVKPGWKRGTTITFEGTRNELRFGSEPTDVAFVIVEKRHPLFRREGNDLVITMTIPLVQALTGCEISIPLISSSGETMNIMIEDIVYPGYQKIIVGQGMPRLKEEGKRGNLRVLFSVEFPDELTEEQRAGVFRILDGSC